MSNPLIRQFQYEVKAWKRTLAFFQEESVQLKLRLSEVLGDELKDAHLDKAEYFHNRFLTEDEIISMLREEVNEQNEWLGEFLARAPSGKLLPEIIQQQKRLHVDMEKAESLFQQIKNEFVEYLFDAISAIPS